MARIANPTSKRKSVTDLEHDCTTLYFESFNKDELRQKGYSKGLYFSQSQVLLAMMVTKEGMPLGIPSKPTLHAQKIYQVMGKKLSSTPFLLQ